MNIKEKHWKIYYRKRVNGHTILDNIIMPFYEVPEYKDGWAADPFVFEYNNKLYIFAELFSYKEGHGNIGYCCLENDKFSNWKIIISNGTHFSYPNIFAKDNDIYIMPENCAGKKIALYKATDFPNEWKEIQPLYKEEYLTDSTFLDENSIITYSVKPNEYKLILLKENKIIDSVKDETQKMRPAGKIFKDKDKIYRPAQDCEHSYGEALIINELTINNDKLPSEKMVIQINADEIKLDKAKGKRIGIHTYNCTENFEVVDVLFETFNLKYLGIRLCKKIKTR